MIRRVVAWRRCCSGRGLELRYSTGKLGSIFDRPRVRPTTEDIANELHELALAFDRTALVIDTPRGPAYTVRGVEELNRMANAADTPPTPHTTIPGQEPPPEHGPRRP